MGWLKRLFGFEKDEAPKSADTPTEDSAIAPERVGLHGEFDQSGLAKRVAAAFDEDSDFDDIDSVYVAQTSSTVVLKGSAPSQEILDKMVMVAGGVSGASSVDVSQVEIS